MAGRKFAALAGIRNGTSAESQPSPEPREADESPARMEGKGRGRPAGKRSNPSYEPTTLLLRKETKKKASRLLEDTDDLRDLSDLAEELISAWIGKHQL